MTRRFTGKRWSPLWSAYPEVTLLSLVQRNSHRFVHHTKSSHLWSIWVARNMFFFKNFLHIGTPWKKIFMFPISYKWKFDWYLWLRLAKISRYIVCNYSTPVYFFEPWTVQKAIKAIEYTAGSTNTDQALELVATHVLTPAGGARKEVAHVVIVVTDGQSASPNRTQQWAREVKKGGAYVFAIGMCLRISDRILFLSKFVMLANFLPLKVPAVDWAPPLIAFLDFLSCMLSSPTPPLGLAFVFLLL